MQYLNDPAWELRDDDDQITHVNGRDRDHGRDDDGLTWGQK